MHRGTVPRKQRPALLAHNRTHVRYPHPHTMPPMALRAGRIPAARHNSDDPCPTHSPPLPFSLSPVLIPPGQCGHSAPPPERDPGHRQIRWATYAYSYEYVVHWGGPWREVLEESPGGSPGGGGGGFAVVLRVLRTLTPLVLATSG